MAKKKVVTFGLSLEQFERLRWEARQQKVSVSELVRRALTYYVSASWDVKKVSRPTPPLYWTREEQEYAHSVIQRHFDEDR